MAAISGATAAPDVASVARQADVTLLSLPTPDVVADVAAAWADAAAPGAVLVDLSTNSPAVVRELGERLAVSGHHLVEAPLTGGAIGAEKRMLVFMVGGDDEPVARVLPVLEPLGRATFHVGALGLGNTMKLLNSLIAFTTTWVSLEGLAMATKAGIEVQKAVEILRTAGASNFFIDRQVETIDGRGRPTQFALELAAKDAGLIVDWGAALGVPDPGGCRGEGCPRRRGRGRTRRCRLERARRRAPSSRRAWRCAGTLEAGTRRTPAVVGRRAGTTLGGAVSPCRARRPPPAGPSPRRGRRRRWRRA